MHKEIGSEFWTGCSPASRDDFSMRPSSIYGTHLFKVVETLSGRTALEHIVEILCTQGKNAAYLPAFCCHTMIEPFLSHGIEVSFYDVEWTGKGLHRVVDLDHAADVIMLLDYFGHTDSETKEIAMRAMEKGQTVIYDATHSMYSKVDYTPYDYIYGSYRKWVDINCGFLAWNDELRNGEITQNDNNENYACVRTELFDLKANYINGGKVMKEQFLPLIDAAETLLEGEYYHKMPDRRSMEVLKTTDAEYLKAKRRDNAKVITAAINELNDERICCINPLLNTLDTPLFVPVMVTPKYKNPLRRYLIEHEIYCPVHWPLSDLHKPNTGSSRLFGSEISLICDQRYAEGDMLRIVETIASFLKNN